MTQCRPNFRKALRLAPQQLSSEYYAQYIEAARNHWWFKGRESVLRAVVQAHVRLQPDAVVADVGSGPGGPTRSLFPSQRIVAVDLSARVLSAYASASAVIVGDASRIPLRPGSLSAICAFDVLEHLKDDGQAVQEWYGALSPGGWLIVTVPAYEALWSVSDDVDRHYRRYRARDLRSCLQGAGLEIVRMSYFNTLLLPGVAVAKWAARLTSKDRAANGRNSELDLRLPEWLERGLESIFGAEAAWLGRANLPMGVSIVALARR